MPALSVMQLVVNTSRSNCPAVHSARSISSDVWSSVLIKKSSGKVPTLRNCNCVFILFSLLLLQKAVTGRTNRLAVQVGLDKYYLPYELMVQAKNRYGDGKHNSTIAIIFSAEACELTLTLKRWLVASEQTVVLILAAMADMHV